MIYPSCFVGVVKTRVIVAPTSVLARLEGNLNPACESVKFELRAEAFANNEKICYIRPLNPDHSSHKLLETASIFLLARRSLPSTLTERTHFYYIQSMIRWSGADWGPST